VPVAVPLLLISSATQSVLNCRYPQGVKCKRREWVKEAVGGALQLERVSSAKWANKCQRAVHFP